MDPTDLVNIGPEQQGMLDLAVPYEGDADIKVFFLGTNKKIYLDTAWGLTNRDAKSCWIVGDTVPSRPRTLTEVMQTTAHEIGHLLVGYGHPDEKGKSANRGLAPLPGTNHRERLMQTSESLSFVYSGATQNAARSHRLVKGRWDEAEKWLKSRPLGDN